MSCTSAALTFLQPSSSQPSSPAIYPLYDRISLSRSTCDISLPSVVSGDDAIVSILSRIPQKRKHTSCRRSMLLLASHFLLGRRGSYIIKISKWVICFFSLLGNSLKYIIDAS